MHQLTWFFLNVLYDLLRQCRLHLEKPVFWFCVPFTESYHIYWKKNHGWQNAILKKSCKVFFKNLDWILSIFMSKFFCRPLLSLPNSSPPKNEILSKNKVKKLRKLTELMNYLQIYDSKILKKFNFPGVPYFKF